VVIGEGAAGEYRRALEEESIPAAVIGRVSAPGGGIAATVKGKPAELPEFDTDEITRLFDEQS